MVGCVDFIAQTQIPGVCGSVRPVIPFLMNGAILIGSGGAQTTNSSPQLGKGETVSPFQELSQLVSQSMLLYGASYTEHYAYQKFIEKH